MNYSDKFDAGTLTSSAALDGQGTLLAKSFDVAPSAEPKDATIVPDAALLFSGDFTRAGNDLILSRDDQSFTVKDYFRGEKHATLASPEGATLSGAVVDLLTGYTQYAQSGGGNVGEAIGKCAKVVGTATVIRNGVSVELNVGDAVYKNDVVQSGSDSQLGITFIDGTAFSLQSNARMVMNEMVYDPQGSQNSSLMTLVQGTLTFVAGQAAKNGNMKIDTPVATMGIRGTAGVVEILANNGETKFTLVVEPGGHTGSYDLIDKNSGTVLGSISQTGIVTFVTPNLSGLPTLAARQQTLDEQRAEREIVQQVFQIFFPQYNDANPGNKANTGSSFNSLAVITSAADAPPPESGITPPSVISTSSNGSTTTTTGQQTIYVNTPPTITVTDSDGVQAGGIPNVEDTQSDTPGDKNFLIRDHVTIVDPDIGGVLNDNPVPYVAFTGSVSGVEAPDSVPEGFDLYALVQLNQETGQVTYDPSNFRFLGAHEQVVFTISFISASGPDFRAQEMTLTIRGLNDAPEFDQDDSALGLVETLIATDSAAEISQVAVLQFHDPDFSDVAAEYTVETLGVTTSGFDDVLPGEATLLSWLQFNSISKNVGTDQGEITQTFAAPDQNFDYLGVDESVTLTYTIRVTDGLDALDTQTVTFTITGSNDGPTITTNTTTALTSGAVAEDGTQAASGTITFRDVDLTDTHTLSHELAGGSISDDLPGFDPATQQLGTLTLVLNENPDDLDAIGTVGWTFTINNALAQQLAEGQVVMQTYTVSIDDGNGGTITQDVTMAVTGTNDAPMIVFAETTASGAVTEDLGVVSDYLTATGTITFRDIDLIDMHTIPDGDLAPVSVTVKDGLGNALPLANFNPAEQHLGTLYLTLSEDAGDTENRGQVQWTFEIDNSDPFVQALAKGQVVTQTYTVTIDDGHDGSVTQTITVTVAGTNDGPVAAADVNAGGEDTVISGSVATNDSDVDTGAMLTYALAPNPSIDGLTFNSDGSYTFDASHASYQYLADGETLDIVVNYTVTDEYGVPSSAALTITLTGTNDVPTVSAEAATGAVAEDDAGPTLSTEGTISFADLDASDSHEVAVAPATGNTLGGTLTATQTGAGVVSWTYEVANAATQYLGDGEQVTESFVVTITDEHGAEVTKTVTITVTGLSNDGVDAVADVRAATEDGVTVTGSVATNDTVQDGQATVTFELVGAGVAGLTFNSDGNYSFDPSHAAYQHLAAGETLNVVETYRIIDVTNNLTDTATLTITLTGANDTPTVSVESSAGSAAEDATTPDLSATGTITFDDVDLIDTHLLSVTSETEVLGTLNAVVGTLAVGAGSGVVDWTYTIDNELVQYLAEDEQLIETFTITIDDGHDGTVTHTVTVTITGTNNAPVIESDDSISEIHEGAVSIAGQLSASDVDGATFIWGMSGSPEGDYGSFAIDEISGEWTYTLDPQAANGLADGQRVDETFFATVTDDHGAMHSREVTVTVIGTNDAPTISAAVSTGTVVEDGTVPLLSTTGTVTFDDPDLIDVHSLSVTPEIGALGGTLIADVGTPATEGGNGTVHWTYEIDNDLVQHLAEDEEATETFTITIDDDEGGTVEQQVTVTVTGTNDAPVLSGASLDLTEVAAEDTTNPGQTVSSFLSSTDADSGALTGIAITGATATGGQWQFSLNNGESWTSFGNYAVASALLLAATDKVRFVPDGGPAPTNTLIFFAWDQNAGMHGAVVDASVRGGSSAFSATSDTVSIDVDTMPGEIITEDDGIEAGSVATAGDPPGATYEVSGQAPDSLVLFENGSYTIDTADFDSLAAGEHASVSVTYDVYDEIGIEVIDTRTLTVRIDGVNDAPVMQDAVLLDATLHFGNALEGVNVGHSVAALLETKGQYYTYDLVSDVDATDGEGIAVTGFTATGGHWEYWLYSTDNDGQPAGGEWVAFGSYSVTNALLLSEQDRVRFVPSGPDATSMNSLTYVAWDLSAGVSGGTADATERGGTTAFSLEDNVVTSTVTHAPTVSAGLQSANFIETMAPISSTTSIDDVDFEGSFDVFDVDLTDQHTISVTPNTNGNYNYPYSGQLNTDVVEGTPGDGQFTVQWSYSTQGGPQKLAAGEIATETFTIAIEDGRGGRAENNVTVTITGTNDAPQLNSSGDPLKLYLVPPGVNNPGQHLSDFLHGVTDVDNNALRGVAVIGAVAAPGGNVWEYSLNGGASWQAFSSYSPTNALLLRDTDLIRFVATSYESVPGALDFIAWDQSAGVAGQVVDASVRGGQTAFSAGGQYGTGHISAEAAHAVVDNDYAGTYSVSGYDMMGLYADLSMRISSFRIDQPGSSDQIELRNENGRELYLTGYNLSVGGDYQNLVVTGGTINRIFVRNSDDGQLLEITGLHIPAVELFGAIGAYRANGSTVWLDALLGDHVFNVDGDTEDDVLVGGNYNDTLTGNGGADVFGYSGGADIITDFAPGDLIDLTRSGVLNFPALMIEATGFNEVDTRINFGSGNSITLVGVDYQSLQESDFIFGLPYLGAEQSEVVVETVRNNGVFFAGDGGTLSVHSLMNLNSDGNLVGGIYDVVDQGSGPTRIEFTGTEPSIKTLNATVFLTGADASLFSNEASLDLTLETIGNHGSVNLHYSIAATTYASFAAQNHIDLHGSVGLYGGDFRANGLTIHQSGFVFGSGELRSGDTGTPSNIVNNGIIAALPAFYDGESGYSSLSIFGNVLGSGMMTISPDAILEFDALSTVSSTQNIYFLGNEDGGETNRVLRIGADTVDQSTMGATIHGFVKSDAIQLTGLDYDLYDHFLFEGSVLTLLGQSDVVLAQLTLAGLSDAADFDVAETSEGSISIAIPDYTPTGGATYTDYISVFPGLHSVESLLHGVVPSLQQRVVGFSLDGLNFDEIPQWVPDDLDLGYAPFISGDYLDFHVKPNGDFLVVLKAGSAALLNQLDANAGPPLSDKFYYRVGDGLGGSAVHQVHYVLDATPQLNVANISVAEHATNGTVTISNLFAIDHDAVSSDTLTVSVTAEHGTVVFASNPASFSNSGTLSEIQDVLDAGFVYTPESEAKLVNDVTLNIQGDHGGDTFHFIFSEGYNAGVDLTGTDQKDVIFSTEGNDVLRGNGGGDVFYFHSKFGDDTIQDFNSFEDVIHFDSSTFANLTAVMNNAQQVGQNTVITLNLGNHLTLAGVNVNQLSASNVQFHDGLLSA